MHLTPTTLELGGKSPCIVAQDCDLQAVALKVAYGKLVNAGRGGAMPGAVGQEDHTRDAGTGARGGHATRPAASVRR